MLDAKYSNQISVREMFLNLRKEQRETDDLNVK
jgi:hypothetical protein